MDEELLRTLGDFTRKENWDKFFTIRNKDDPFEWYSEWPDLRDLLLRQIGTLNSEEVQILVPGCGNSRLSEFLYDAGFTNITNIDFSKVVISDMLRKHLRERPKMKWRVMDMTDMQFAENTFDIVIDKGGLDALMEPEQGTELGNLYLSEVKRVLKSRGKFLCITLAESHVSELLFSKFRFGWKNDIQLVIQNSSSSHGFQTFLFVASGENSSSSSLIQSSFGASIVSHENQVRGLLQAIETENRIRTESTSGNSDYIYCLEDLHLGPKGDLGRLSPGRRFHLRLRDKTISHFSYRAVLMDSKQASNTFSYSCGVFLVPEARAHEWLFSSEEGQWLVVESAKAARLIMVFLDSEHNHIPMDAIQNDLSPIIKKLAPGNLDEHSQIPFMMANDGVKQRDLVHQVTSVITGRIIVEDVVYEETSSSDNGHIAAKDAVFRRLSFERSMGLVQSEALMIRKTDTGSEGQESRRKKSGGRSRSTKRGQNRDPPVADEMKDQMTIDHSYLASFYHTSIIAGFSLIASAMGSIDSNVKTVVIGLGGGLLPMSLHQCMPILDIEVIELDPVIVDVAKYCFGFVEDDHLKVQVGDGIEFLNKIAQTSTRKVDKCKTSPSSSTVADTSCSTSESLQGELNTNNYKVHVVIIDADSSDLKSGLTCPPADFVEESFLSMVKESLYEVGLFVINMVSRSPSIRKTITERMKKVFAHLFSLGIEEDVNEVLFALPTHRNINDDFIQQAADQLQKLLCLSDSKSSMIIETAKKIQCLK